VNALIGASKTRVNALMGLTQHSGARGQHFVVKAMTNIRHFFSDFRRLLIPRYIPH